MKHRHVRFNITSYLQLSELGAAFNLIFSGCEVLGNKIIGVDEIKRKLLVAEKKEQLTPSCIIELEKVCAIKVKKIYNSIQAGELKKKKIDHFLESIHLQFELNKGKDVITLTFYDKEVNGIHDLPDMERKARGWQMRLSKMTGVKKKQFTKEKLTAFQSLLN